MQQARAQCGRRTVMVQITMSREVAKEAKEKKLLYNFAPFAPSREIFPFLFQNVPS